MTKKRAWSVSRTRPFVISCFVIPFDHWYFDIRHPASPCHSLIRYDLLVRPERASALTSRKLQLGGPCRSASERRTTTGADDARRNVGGGWDAVDVVLSAAMRMWIIRACDGDLAPRLGGGRLSRRRAEPAGLEVVRARRAIRPAAALLRDSAAIWIRSSIITPPTRKSATTMPIRRRPHRLAGPIERPLPYCHRAARRSGVPVIAGGSRRRCAARPLRLLERHRPQSILLDAKATSSSTAWARKSSSKSRSVWRRSIGEGVAAICAALRTLGQARCRWRAKRQPQTAEATRHAPEGFVDLTHAPPETRQRFRSVFGLLPSFEDVKADKAKIRRRHAHHPHQHEPVQCPNTRCSSTTVRPSWSRRAVAAAEKDMDRVYDLPYTRRPHPGVCRADSGVRDESKTRSRSCAAVSAVARFAPSPRIKAASSSRASQKSILREIRAMAADADFRAPSATLAAPRRNVPDALLAGPTSKPSANASPVFTRRLANSWAPIRPTPQLMERGRHEPGIRKVLVASGIAYGPGPARPPLTWRIWPPTTSAAISKSLPSIPQPRPRTHEKARQHRFRGFAASFKKASAKAGKPSNSSSPTTSPATPAPTSMR